MDSKDEKPRIAIIGAGPMGLGVAYELVRQGFNPVIYEADDRIGGMTACFDFDGLQIERFYHFHCLSDSAFIRILEELGLTHKLHWRETKMGYWFKNQLQPWGNPLALLRFRGLSLLAKVRYGLFAFYCTKLKNWHRIDHLEATNWIRHWVGPDAYEALWHKLFFYKFYEYSESLSASWIWARIRRIGRSRSSLMRESLGYLEGGSNTLLVALEKYLLANGAMLKLSSRIEQVVVKDNVAVGIRCDDVFEPFDKVISTIPLPFVPSMIPDLPDSARDAYKALKNVAVVCVICKLRRTISENFWVNVNDEKMAIPGLVEYSNLHPMEHSIVYVPFYIPGTHEKYRLPDEHFEQECKTYLTSIQPELRDEDILAVKVSRYRWAQPVCGPRFMETLPPPKTEIEGLWVADTSHYYPEDRGISESLEFGRDLARQITHLR